jgi:prepilin-type N-terminal cleavage/methylation domain-containing protein
MRRQHVESIMMRCGKRLPPEKAGGFTLIELLVVIAIIGILASLLLPSLATSKEQAQRTKCTSNLKQVGLFFQMYTSDNHDSFPCAPAGWPTMPCVDLLKLQHPYISTNNRTFFRCPAEQGIGFNYELYAKRGFDTNVLPFPCSYYYFASFYQNNIGVSNAPAPYKISQVRYPTRKALEPCFASANDALFDADLDPPMNGAHGPGFNLLFVDLHAQFIGWRQLNPCPANPTRPYNFDNDPLAEQDTKQ